MSAHRLACFLIALAFVIGLASFVGKGGPTIAAPAGGEDLTIVQHLIAGDIVEEPCCTITPDNFFPPSAARAYSFVELSGDITGHVGRWEFIDPQGEVYFYTEDSPVNTLNWAWIGISGQPAAGKLGEWRVKYYLDGALRFQDRFTISTSPEPSPTPTPTPTTMPSPTATPTPTPTTTPSPSPTPTPQPQGITITLAAGWNILPYLGPTLSVPEALTSISGKYSAVYALEPSQQDWDSYDPNAPPFLSELQELEQNSAYMIRMASAGTLIFPENVPLKDTLSEVPPGWYLFVHLDPTASVPEALDPISGRYKVVYGLKAAQQEWDSYDPRAPFLSDLQQLKQHDAYMMLLSSRDDGLEETVPPPFLLPDDFGASTQGLASALASLNRAELKFIHDAGANTAAFDGDLLEVAAAAMASARSAERLGNTMAIQDGASEDAGKQADLYYGVARLAYLLVVEAQNLRDGLGAGSISADTAVAIIAEYGARLWNVSIADGGGGNPFLAYLGDASSVPAAQFMTPAAVASVKANFGAGVNITAWLAASQETVDKRITLPSGPPSIDPFDTGLLGQLSTPAGQSDGDTARQVAYFYLAALAGASPDTSPTEITVPVLAGTAIAGADAIALGQLLAFAGGNATALAQVGASGLSVAAAGPLDWLGSFFSTPSPNDPQARRTVELTEVDPKVSLHIRNVAVTGNASSGFNVTMTVRWIVSYGLANFTVTCPGGFSQAVNNIDGEASASWTERTARTIKVGCVAWMSEGSGRLRPIAYSPLVDVELKEGDTDGDGIIDTNDRCKDVPGVESGRGCPDPDGDGVPNSDANGDGVGDDDCPSEAGTGAANGCPDKDGDKVADRDDGCPDDFGSRYTDPKGCPDADKDGIQDNDDECDNDSGPEATKGCPDGDNDLVPDKDDDCKATPFSQRDRVNSRGCGPDERDTDGDGITDTEDLCSTQAGPKETDGCPDRDGDKVADHEDGCPDEAGSSLASPKGCPDADNDYIADKDDECDNEQGPKESKGCPDGDFDRVPDKDDACKNTPTAERGGVDARGCGPSEKDTDEDGIKDADDICVSEKGPKETGGCPDKDNDRVPDFDDKCPDDPGPTFLKGCPDTDEDGVADKDDACPTEKGPKDTRGCPDKDGDFWVDKDDNCPNNANVGQEDTDGDGMGDVCDPSTRVPFDSYRHYDNVFATATRALTPGHYFEIVIRGSIRLTTGNAGTSIMHINGVTYSGPRVIFGSGSPVLITCGRGTPEDPGSTYFTITVTDLGTNPQ